MKKTSLIFASVVLIWAPSVHAEGRSDPRGEIPAACKEKFAVVYQKIKEGGTSLALIRPDLAAAKSACASMPEVMASLALMENGLECAKTGETFDAVKQQLLRTLQAYGENGKPTAELAKDKRWNSKVEEMRVAIRDIKKKCGDFPTYLKTARYMEDVLDAIERGDKTFYPDE
jgi:hypothetical protein